MEDTHSTFASSTAVDATPSPSGAMHDNDFESALDLRLLGLKKQLRITGTDQEKGLEDPTTTPTSNCSNPKCRALRVNVAMVLEALPPIHLLFRTDENEAARLLDQEREVRRGLQKALEEAYLKLNDLSIAHEAEVEEHTCTMEMLEEMEKKMAGMQENTPSDPQETDKKEKTSLLLRKEREEKLELQRLLEIEKENTKRAREEMERVQSQLATAKEQARDSKLKLEIFKKGTSQQSHSSEIAKLEASTEKQANGMKFEQQREEQENWHVMHDQKTKELAVWKQKSEKAESNVTMLMMMVCWLMAILAIILVIGDRHPMIHSN